MKARSPSDNAASSPNGDRRRALAFLELGLTAEHAGKTQDALNLYRQAVDADAACAQAHMYLAIALQAKQEFKAAISSHHRAIELDSGSAAAHHNFALTLLDAGDATQAEREFRQSIHLRNQFPEAFVGLAEALETLGRDEDALVALATAIELRNHYAGAKLNSAMLLQKLGRAEAAKSMLRSINLGLLMREPDRYLEVEVVARQLTQAWPDYPDGWRALGTVLALQKRFAEAAPALQKALTWLSPDAELHNNLGVALDALGRWADAEACYRKALERKHDYVEARNNLGKVVANLQRNSEAIAEFESALRFAPDFIEAHTNLGNAYRACGRMDEAEKSYSRALALEPNSPTALNNLSVAQQNLGRLLEARVSLQRAIALKPDYYEAHTNLGNVSQALGSFSEAEMCYRKALTLSPDAQAVHSNLGTALRELGRIDEAVSCFRRAIEIDPGYSDAHSNLLFTLNYTTKLTRAELYEEHIAWARQTESPRAARRSVHEHPRDPLKRLRIGYVSPDFRRHSVAFFIEPVLAEHSRSHFEVVCYSNVLRPDEVTRRLLEQADHVRNIVGLSDVNAAAMVRSDKVDILIDLAGHTGRARLGLFALKPAPVQASYLGYPNTTGLASMDWRITDACADPQGDGDALHSERLLRLPDSFLCFRPPENAPTPAPAPCLKNGFITFGSFNALAKISAPVVDAWSGLLERVPRSRLLLKAMGLSDPQGRQRILEEFAQRGIDANRLDALSPEIEFRTHISRYHLMDIALDPFPYNGTTTTLEALWMGVPVIALAGDRHCGRVGASILSNLDLGELIAPNLENYLVRAAALAADVSRLVELRGTMRERVASSPLRNEKGFVRSLEQAYGAMWRDWCDA